MRLDFDTLAPGFSKAMGRLDTASGEGPLEAPLRELVRADAAKAFDEAELAQLLATIVTINAWNRIGVAARCWTPGSYQP